MTASMCRACTNQCRLVVEVDQGRLTKVSGDRSDPIYRGFSCRRGVSAPAFYNHPDRLLGPLKRQSDGSYRPLPLAQALDEIAERLAGVVRQHGPRAVASYWGMMAVANGSMMPFLDAFMAALGSPMTFTASTIDKPGRAIAQAMVGEWQAPRHGYDDPDAMLLVGINPLTSYQGVPMGNPGEWYLERLAAGMQLFVIDPRRSDIARRATIHLQPRPGTDAALIAAILRVVLDETRFDQAFVAEEVRGVEALRAAVDPFGTDRAAALADVSPVDLLTVARGFASAGRGAAIAGTGPAMAGSGTLVDYLLIGLDTVLGHYARAGEPVRQPGVLMPEASARAQASPPRPAYGVGEQMRARDVAGSAAGLPTGVLPDEILFPGEGGVRALISCSGNPANAWPDQARTMQALHSLDLLVQIDPWMSATARVAHYILPPKLPYETPTTTRQREFGARYAYPSIAYGQPFGQYFPVLLDPPPGSDLAEEWEMFAGLALRLGLELEVLGGNGSPFRLDPAAMPTSDELIEVFCRGSRVPLDQVKRHPDGAFFPGDPLIVRPKEPGHLARLDVGNPDMMADLAREARRFTTQRAVVADHPFRLLCRRTPGPYNSSFHDRSTLPGPQSNPAHLHPADLTALGAAPGDLVEIRSRRGRLVAEAAADPDLRRGTVSMSHGFGPRGTAGDPEATGVNVNELLGAEGIAERYSGQPLMSNVPVAVRPLRA